MKFILVSGIYFPDIGGPATFIPKLAENLVRNGYQVTTLALEDSKQIRSFEPWERFFIKRKLPRILRFPIVVGMLILKGKNCSVVFANGLHEESVIASKILGKKVILKVVGNPIWERAKNRGLTTLDIKTFSDSKIPKKLFLEKQLFRWALASADKVITPSKELETLMKQMSANCKTQVIPNGVKVNKVTTKQKKYDVIYFGRLTKWKELATLIDAVEKCHASLVIVGDGPERFALEKKANAIGANVSFKGQLSQENLKELIEQSRIFCLPSSYEGMSHSLLEAMSNEIPVIVSDIEPNLELIENEFNGLTFTLRNPQNLSESIKLLLGSAELRKYLSENAKKDVIEKYEESQILKKYLSILVAE